MKRLLIFLLTVSMIVGMLSLVGCTAGEVSEKGEQEEKRELFVSSWGGLWEESFKKHVIEPFEQKYNVKVTHSLSGAGGEAIARLRAEKNAPKASIDVFGTGGGFEIIAADEGLFLPLDENKIPNLKDIAPALNYKNFVVSPTISSVGIAYHTERVPRVPNSWLDFWDPSFELVAISSIDVTTGRGFLGRINDMEGGTSENFEPGLAKLKELLIDKRAIIADGSDEIANSIVQGGAHLALGLPSRFLDLKAEGFPVEFIYPEEGSLIWGASFGVPSNSANVDLAMEFINFMLDPIVVANFCQAVHYSPANLKAEIPETYKYYDMIFTKEDIDRAYPLDWNAINKYQKEWSEIWATEYTPLLK